MSKITGKDKTKKLLWAKLNSLGLHTFFIKMSMRVTASPLFFREIVYPLVKVLRRLNIDKSNVYKMSDYCISIVPKLSTYPNKEKKVKEVLEWLVSLDIVKATQSDCILGTDYGYAISAGAKLVTVSPEYLPFDSGLNGLEINIGRQVFTTGGNGIEEVVCPSCNADMANEDWDFLNEWSENKTDDLICPLCNVGTDIHKFVFIPEWGFSDLGFTFWRWTGFTDAFIGKFKEMPGCDINLVYQRI